MTDPLAIVGSGAVTPVGFSAVQSSAAIRAGISRFKLHGCRDPVKGPTLLAEVPLRPRPPAAEPLGRLVHMATMALLDCLASAHIRELVEWPLLLGVREPFRVGPRGEWSNTSLLTAIERRSGLSLHPLSRVFPLGNASAFAAVSHARELLAAERIAGCLVGGVDSLLNAADTTRFGDAYRLKSEEVAQGFVPGEGAAIIAVTRPQAGARSTILGVGITREEEGNTVLRDGYPTGKALAAAVRAALTHSRIHEARVAFRVSDMNGETYRALESMLALGRIYRTRRETFPQVLPAASVGEMAAAAGAMTMILAAAALGRGYAPGKIAVCEASSDGGMRAACLIQGL